MKDKYSKRSEMENINKILDQLKEYVENSFDVQNLRKAKENVNEQLKTLKEHKFSLEKPRNA